MFDDATAASRPAVDVDGAVDVFVGQAGIFDGATSRFSFEMADRQDRPARYGAIV